MAEPVHATNSEKIAQEIYEGRITGTPVQTKLATNERVLARVTDGIYRQPSSAIRELIANAYDADATDVNILTDAPRFEKIIVRDNGNGLTPDILAHVIRNIGGSPKRTFEGERLGVTKEGDASLSPKGRPLIGKIGIGLFSVSQLTSHFQIITKVAGEQYRTVADVIIHAYNEDNLASQNVDHHYETGSVKIWSEHADDVEGHGTEIILLKIKSAAREILQSKERWEAVFHNEQRDVTDESPELAIERPIYHIGSSAIITSDELRVEPNLPWDNTDQPEVKIKKLVSAMAGELGYRTNPRLSSIFDNYLTMLWSLSLAIPTRYIRKHPFDLTTADKQRFFLLSNESKGQAKEITLESAQTVGQTIGVTTAHEILDDCKVYLDGVKLLRPIVYQDLPETSHPIKHPLMFIGKCSPDLSKIPPEYRGGELSFEGYLFWTPKVVPKDHSGVLVRIHEASGTLFDETFMKYQISEQTRLRQIVAEIFVTKGLDSALNIDRESFNYAHPHYQYIQKWLHNSLRQLSTAQKRIAKSIRDALRETETDTLRSEIQLAAVSEWEKVRGATGESVPNIVFAESSRAAGEVASGIIFQKEKIIDPVEKSRRTSSSVESEKRFEETLKGIATILTAYGVFDDMPHDTQHEILRAIGKIIALEAF